MKNKVRPIAIVLPQFHPIPENDEWWGPGFTEWRNVVKARPRFRGHYQPHLPRDLGFYDLRLPETREAQAALARRYGIYGFCYYHYWFNGRRLLQEPVERVLASGRPDFPFMLAWANENWTRVWNGGEKEVLISQEYSEFDHANHVRHLIPFFKDPRYITIDGKPVFAIYKDGGIPDVERAVEIFRREAARERVELYMCRFDVRGQRREPPEALGFDAAIEFHPFTKSSSVYLEERKSRHRRGKAGSCAIRVANGVRRLLGWGNRFQIKESDKIYDYEDYVRHDLSRDLTRYKTFPGVFPGWDNTSRREHGGATIFINSSPEAFGRWVEKKVRRYTPPNEDENLFFINAWNEWAEGNHLEPCERFGLRYLEAFSMALLAGDTQAHGRRATVRKTCAG
jgi:lipopolysaccharide biosynthesis protein